MAIIAIDGACKRNGKPDCVSAGGVLVITENNEFSTNFCHEFNSTNQRGELYALLKALEIGLHLFESKPETTIYFITDSEYIMNTINKEWYKNWQAKGWVTASNEPVKNKDLWSRAAALLELYENNMYDFVVYHIKGHVIPFGKVTAANLIKSDETGKSLYDAVETKLKGLVDVRPEILDHAKEVFLKNYGFNCPEDKILQFVSCNMTVDLLAVNYLENTVK